MDYLCRCGCEDRRGVRCPTCGELPQELGEPLLSTGYLAGDTVRAANDIHFWHGRDPIPQSTPGTVLRRNPNGTYIVRFANVKRPAVTHHEDLAPRATKG